MLKENMLTSSGVMMNRELDMAGTATRIDSVTETKAGSKGKSKKNRPEFIDKHTAWEIVQLARNPYRPFTLDYINLIMTDFVELHGDRGFRDDGAIVGGFANFNGEPVVVLGHQRGKTTEEKLRRNFGMSYPEGYRKALRLMKLAEKFQKPVFTFIDTPGAFPGLEAEGRGSAEAIANNLKEMSRLKTPIISVIIGEGGSGGALAIGVADRILMLENAIYSVISPEGCAAILWNDESKAAEAAKRLKISAGNLLNMGIVDEIVPEPEGGAHIDYERTAANLKRAFINNLTELKELSPYLLVEQRYEKFRRIGEYLEE